MRGRGRLAAALMGLLVVANGCTLRQSAFERQTGDAGSALAAAEATLRYAHEGKLTARYARASFVSYREELSGLDRQLPTLQGAPDPQTVRTLIDLYRRAEPSLRSPCLEASCDWRGQVQVLHQASAAFLNAGGG